MQAKKLQAAALSTQPVYIEDVFSTYLYTGNGSTQTITNGIDLAGKGGLVWGKRRNTFGSHQLVDSNRGVSSYLSSELADAAVTGTRVSSFNSNGFSLTNNPTLNNLNDTYTSWTFRKAPKFFDVVTYTGDSQVNRVLNHNLGTTPGAIFIKVLNSNESWNVFHNGLPNGLGTGRVFLDLTNAVDNSTLQFLTADNTAITFKNNAAGNFSGNTYVAYLFAHDAGGFGEDGSENVISCGSYTGNSSSQSISIGYEPQWILVKNITNVSDWQIIDVMRGMSYTSFSPLYANLSNAETTGTSYRFEPTATGWNLPNAGAATYNTTGNTYIYIAIRRGPMKTPTTGTEVFSPVARSGNNANTTVAGSSGVSDLAIIKNRNTVITQTPFWASRLTANNFLLSSATDAESGAGTAALQSNSWDVMSGIKVGTGGAVTVTNASGQEYVNYLFTRAPGFFDVVCYTGTGSWTTVNHNLGVTPELLINKSRANADNWWVWAPSTGSGQLFLNSSGALPQLNGYMKNATNTTFEILPSYTSNIAYLFATLPGVSKVFSYTGNGSSQTINCGFTGGARFVLIKRTDNTGDWYVWDSARGIVAGNDPHLSLNTTAAEVTTDDSVDTDSTGFIVNQLAATNINVNAATYIGLAIA